MREINGRLFIKTFLLLQGVTNMNIVCEFRMKEGDATWSYQCSLRSNSFSAKLRANVLVDGKELFGTGHTVISAETADLAFAQVCDAIYGLGAQIDVYEHLNNIEVWGDYSQYIGLWQYNKETDKIERIGKGIKRYYDPDEYK